MQHRPLAEGAGGQADAGRLQTVHERRSGTIKFNTELLHAGLADLAAQIDRAPEDARFIFNDDTHELEVTQPATIGREIDVDNSMKTIQEKLYAGEHTIALAINYSNPPLTDQTRGEDIGVRELIHTETSYFTAPAQPGFRISKRLPANSMV